MKSEVFNMCCISAMRGMADKAFDLAIVDPPYQNKDALGLVRVNTKPHKASRTAYHAFDDVRPPAKYFTELKRVSKAQIIWGGNWFGLSGGYICWLKEGTAFGEAELAYCSLIQSVRIFKFTWNGMIQENMKNKEQRIHPTQKPCALYRFLLMNYAKEGENILDTHLGSGSSRIAAYDLGFDFTGYEIDESYFQAAEQRFQNHLAQPKLFQAVPMELTQGSLI